MPYIIKKKYLYLLKNVMKEFEDEIVFKLKLSNVQTFAKWVSGIRVGWIK